MSPGRSSNNDLSWVIIGLACSIISICCCIVCCVNRSRERRQKIIVRKNGMRRRNVPSNAVVQQHIPHPQVPRNHPPILSISFPSTLPPPPATPPPPTTPPPPLPQSEPSRALPPSLPYPEKTMPMSMGSAETKDVGWKRESPPAPYPSPVNESRIAQHMNLGPAFPLRTSTLQPTPSPPQIVAGPTFVVIQSPSPPAPVSQPVQDDKVRTSHSHHSLPYPDSTRQTEVGWARDALQPRPQPPILLSSKPIDDEARAQVNTVPALVNPIPALPHHSHRSIRDRRSGGRSHHGRYDVRKASERGHKNMSDRSSRSRSSSSRSRTEESRKSSGRHGRSHHSRKDRRRSHRK